MLLYLRHNSAPQVASPAKSGASIRSPGGFGEIPSFASVEYLPQAPDAVFLAVPRHGVSEVLAELRDAGAGGIVCYTAGFNELGGQGADLERDLIAACGEMALAGPNVFGLLNYVSEGAPVAIQSWR